MVVHVQVTPPVVVVVDVEVLEVQPVEQLVAPVVSV
jgi:hypothetical protein